MLIFLGLLLKALGILRGLRLLVSYVSNNSFPQPLPEEEERKYLLLWKQGNEEARGTLIEHNLRLVAHIAKKYESSGDDPDDLISIGTIGLMKAVNTYDMDKGTKLATYAARCIDNEILMHLRSTKRIRHDVYIREPIGVDKEGNEITLLDTLPFDGDSVPEIVETQLQQERLQKLLSRLDRRERMVLMLRFGLVDSVRLTQREIARELRISRSYVSRIEKKAMQRLAEEIQKEGDF